VRPPARWPCSRKTQLPRAVKVRRSLLILISTAPTRKLEGGQCAHAPIDEPPCMLSRPCVLQALYHSGAPAHGPLAGSEHVLDQRHGSSSLLNKPLFCATRRSRQHPTSELSSIGNLGTVRSTACLNSTRPSPMGGRLPSLSVLRFSAHPCNPGTHTETPWRSADALCWLRACRLLHHSRAKGRQGGSRAPHGAACAERGVVERGGAVCSGDVGTEARGRTVARRTVIELEGPWRVVPAVHCV
jgi:hypothetical protein